MKSPSPLKRTSVPFFTEEQERLQPCGSTTGRPPKVQWRLLKHEDDPHKWAVPTSTTALYSHRALLIIMQMLSLSLFAPYKHGFHSLFAAFFAVPLATGLTLAFRRSSSISYMQQTRAALAEYTHALKPTSLAAVGFSGRAGRLAERGAQCREMTDDGDDLSERERARASTRRKTVPLKQEDLLLGYTQGFKLVSSAACFLRRGALLRRAT